MGMLDRRGGWILCSAIALYALSLALPAVNVLDKPLFGGGQTAKVYPGVICAAMGWLVLPGWLGNPMFLAAAICHGLRRHRVAIVLLSIGLLSSLLAPLMFVWTRKEMIELTDVRVGYYVWIASMVVLLGGATRGAISDVDRRPAQHR